MPNLQNIVKEGCFDADVRSAINANAGKIEEGTPASATAAGTPGQILYDTSYLYVCVASGTWLRAAIATW